MHQSSLSRILSIRGHIVKNQITFTFKLNNLKYQDIKQWDSVGHMHLISVIEKKFKIQMDINDIIDFSSFKQGKKILKKYKIKI